MGIFDGVLLCSDIDGTLVCEGEVSRETEDAIEFFKSEGGLFTVSTGRYPSHFKDNFGIEVNTHVISVNGTVISDESGKNILYNSKLPLELINRIYDYVFSRYEIENFWAADIDRMDLPYKRKADYPSNKLMFVPYDEKSALALMGDLNTAFASEVNVSRSWPVGVEVIPEGSGKGFCVSRLKEITGSRILVCAGDYENDITMLRAADVGFAVKNAVCRAKEAADRTTVSDSRTAVAEIIETIQKEYIKE